ncbi:hypothetical protein [Ethanoligenens harbinense]|uniref:Uncharacterized protein n=1 Tax=Ethanoligenens harbinense (strain DSM 18485 / JCM 12961 / CGMCC 1.5033 / YUAN-3) TaxID=663278 RepID=E6U7J7_ETHHY|nr:hypothetical protein [Ethanoligenens harbinense]ADU27020.1 hypothetical protein Ethha_1483 [Ethanoligenens harbinense YUAN-3]AVQ96107.1 hypothetical protein CXQ68_07625 [Ethanoligenens harbinense YUAN-3]AYF38768.1 hypothetical protein CXP51_07495 [Ethanoligenens harbinense]AYF41516.1 hypothetical protein CN246_07635 [Ethanoligenens harbinense]QCN92348.1 hypothetical protein DRA42_07655 [Ethanoligenens harbinense]
MKKTKIKEVVLTCLNQGKLCRIDFRYDLNYRYYIPLIASDKLFLGMEDDDFILDGYAIRRFKDVTKAQIKEGIYEKILHAEGVFNGIVTPNVDLTDWKTIFTSLQKKSQNIIVEKESLDENEWEFVIGRIEKIYKKHVYIRHFDAEGIWQSEPYKIPYAEITTVTFASRYVDVFSKYLSKLPDNFGK